MGVLRKRIFAAFLVAALALAFLDLCLGHQCGHHHHSHHDDDQHHQQHQHGSHGQHRDLQGYEDGLRLSGSKLPEELAEEEDLKLYGIGFHRDHDHDHDHDHENGHERVLSGLGLWVHAMACSLLVSMASLICLILLPFIFVQGKPSKAVVDSLAVFGAGAMLGDAFLHQLPHAFGGKHSHSPDHSEQHAHDHARLGQGPSHAHSLEDLSVGLSILAGIVLFLLVEKLVRYVDDASGGVNAWGHSHHQHHIKKHKKLKDDVDDEGDLEPHSITDKEESTSQKSEKEMMGIASSGRLDGETRALDEPLLRKRNIQACSSNDKPCLDANGSRNDSEPLKEKEPYDSPSNLVFGYLNLFSDGVHNFTDGMALGSAFYLYGSVGGWSRTLFLLAHELPQEVGDFGILVRSGFTVSKALCFNFLSALVALAGTALALLLGQNPGQSSFIEGFTAGGFIYIAVAGVLAEMNNNGQSTLKSTAIQLTLLVLGMMVALCISLVE